MPGKNFYITTTLPYVNDKPHVGFAMEAIRADVIARFKRIQGYEVFFNTGTDEHGLKIYEAAFKNNISPQEHVDQYVLAFYELKKQLNLTYDRFIRTTDPDHVSAAQAFWKRCFDNGDIYKKKYQAKYCVGCEMERHDSELENGRCFLHPNLDLKLIEEENYFFAYSKYQQALIDFYEKTPDFVIPDFRFNEIRSFVKGGLNDFSISRLKSKMPWGIPVPGDDDHVMYVWFDALVNYISTLGWPHDEKYFNDFWANGTPVQYCGKDNLRQQSAMWQAMLMSAKLPLTRHVVIDGFITSNGQKMSKSLGNVINPLDVVNEYDSESLRYFLLREISSFEDGDFTMEKFKDAYNGNLANGIGNLTSRILKMAETNLSEPVVITEENKAWSEEYVVALESFNIKKAIDIVFEKMKALDEEIQATQPFKLVKTDPLKGKEIITNLVICLNGVAQHLEPFLPETSRKIIEAVKANKMPSEALFQRKD